MAQVIFLTVPSNQIYFICSESTILIWKCENARRTKGKGAITGKDMGMQSLTPGEAIAPSTAENITGRKAGGYI